MHTEFLMGNEAIALGALAAGVNVVCGYPGTPSSEVLETVAKRKTEHTYVEWSVNEKAAMELAAGAAYSGARALVTMKQVGLNVASDPLMSLEYVGVKGGMVVLVADDPGPISSQTEQDTRTFAAFSKVPCFDPSTPEEAYEMIQEAFDFSEKYGTPVFLRPTTRVDHGYASIDVKDESEYYVNTPGGFVKDSSRWVIFPRLSFANHAKIEARNEELRKTLSGYARNCILGGDVPKKGVAAGGISYAYAKEELEARGTDGTLPARLMKVSTPFPFPEDLALEFLKDLDEVLVLEELDPVIEKELTYLCGKHGLQTKIYGKLSHHIAPSGENTRDSVGAALDAFLGTDLQGAKAVTRPEPPQLPVRPPGYTLGNAMPLDMCDTCLCMGAGVNIAQGIRKVDPDTTVFAFVGDSTFFASAITGVINAVYNQANMTLVLLDNSTTAMTGHQPHPGTGRTMMGEVVEKIDPVKVLEGIGVTEVVCLDPMDLATSVPEVQRVSALPGVKAVIFRYPCIALFKPTEYCEVDQSECINCRRCIKELGCPALFIKDGHVEIDPGTCTGCGLCNQVCPKKCIGGVTR